MKVLGKLGYIGPFLFLLVCRTGLGPNNFYLNRIVMSPVG